MNRKAIDDSIEHVAVPHKLYTPLKNIYNYYTTLLSYCLVIQLVNSVSPITSFTRFEGKSKYYFNIIQTLYI